MVDPGSMCLVLVLELCIVHELGAYDGLHLKIKRLSQATWESTQKLATETKGVY